MTPQLRTALLGSVQANRLSLLVGAGLSMAAPSGLPPAWQVANYCYDEFVAKMGALPPGIRDDLEAVSEEIGAQVDLRNVFIQSIVPWQRFVRPPNAGHISIADLLLTGAARACLSANYDGLIERAGADFGADLQTALSGDQATEISASQSPLLKFHGCMIKDRDHTVWTKSQFQTDATLADRKAANVVWMRANLQQKDILIVGFWSDWSYLNDIFEEAFDSLSPRSVTIVDPTPTASLQTKAPSLWNVANLPNVTFTHVQESGHSFLEELQAEVSQAFFRQMLAQGAAEFAALRPGVQLAPGITDAPALSASAYYAWRRDATGVTNQEPVRSARPDQTCQATGLAHVLVRQSGGAANDIGYALNGTTVRVVNGAGRLLSKVRNDLAAGPAVVEADVVICAGATDLGVPGDIVRDQQPATTVRPGVEGRWMTLPLAIEELQL